jgi:hypothetical protein
VSLCINRAQGFLCPFTFGIGTPALLLAQAPAKPSATPAP